jgi:SAM-dependent methyltransferase
MDKKVSCILCNSESSLFARYREAEYHRCLNCRAVFMDPAFHPSAERERERYEKHNNDINDPGYREFVSPLVNMVIAGFSKEHRGLDFGAGTGPVAASLLRENGYSIELYDPFFHNDTAILTRKYDYIICIEVIEHFHDPAKEFGLMRSLLNTRGSLICMTHLYTDEIDFNSWRYKDDLTHVIFYHPESLEWINSTCHFTGFNVNDRIIQFSS